MKMEIVCSYRNCEEKFDDLGGVKKFCCRSCKSKEAVYRIRDKKVKGKRGRKLGAKKNIDFFMKDG